MYLLSGVGFSGISLFITNHFLLGTAGEAAKWRKKHHISPTTAMKYIVVVFIEVFKAGFHAIWLTLRGKLNVGIVDIATESDETLRNVLIADAITLTPGTVTIDYSHRNLKVVWMDRVTEDPEEAGRIIKGSFERVFHHDHTKRDTG